MTSYDGWDVRIPADITTTDATQTTIESVAVAEDQAVVIRAEVVGAIDTYASAIGISVWGVFRRASAGNVTLVGSLQGTAQEDDADTPAITLTANTTNQTVDVNVTGIASETWTWAAKVEVLPVG